MKLKYISWIPAVVVMVVIFIFSATPADNSDESSKSIADRLVTIYENIAKIEYDHNAREELIDKVNFIVRKGAHFSEFALLACCVCLHLAVLKYKGGSLLLRAISFTALYAATDELHQYFIPGRGCRLSDVLLDSCGAAAGALFFYLLFRLYIKMRPNPSAQSD